MVPKRIFCPLGVGGHPDHLFVRQTGIDLWQSWNSKPELFFYEDLPYAAWSLTGHSTSEMCIADVSRSCGSMRVEWRPLTAGEMRNKLLASRAYVSQTDHTSLLLRHARTLGRQCSADFAEMYFTPR